MQAPEFIIHPLDALAQIDPQIEQFIESELPHISEDELRKIAEPDATCAICMTAFTAVIAEEELAQAMDSPAAVVENMGVTRLHKTCGHMFCRKDITTWLRTAHTTCPTCRTPILTRPSSPSTEANRDVLRDALQQLQGSLEDAAVLEGFPTGTGLNAAGQDVDFNLVRALNALQTDSPSTQELSDLLSEMLAARQGATQQPRRDEEIFNTMYA
ncbi:hypothetical protein EXIGLDRAFT_827719 [Exidia glandulosa HHB12029]|uniref:RING-type domain-containing protein n=1 Tax=Exidia glandulosa HHB12029 TaxID=1314781 RepID=A0A165QKP7_EXIGL|nr:hypothetical protein EXIGLDRAFT_827719 [Exidia glandulosa HHB12029]